MNETFYGCSGLELFFFLDRILPSSSFHIPFFYEKRLGHAGLRNVTTSVLYAEEIADNKIKDQPQAPIGAEDLLAGMPASGMEY
jgi:hypothetical protein